jgi:hypothetical protein
MIYFCAVVHALIELNIYVVVQPIMMSPPTLRIKNAFHRFPNAELAYKIMVIIKVVPGLRFAIRSFWSDSVIRVRS